MSSPFSFSKQQFRTVLDMSRTDKSVGLVPALQRAARLRACSLKDHGAENLPVLRRAVQNMVKLDKSRKLSNAFSTSKCDKRRLFSALIKDL